MSSVRFGISAIALGVALAFNAPAFAQEEAAPAAEDSGASDIITVTANRRAERLDDVPAAISAVSGEALASEGVTSSRDLQNVVPNISVGPAGFAIRGVASADFTEKGDPSTSYNMDGIYIARPTEQALTMFDVGRVEVLRGPQGTLYGRNATAGVINVISNRPTQYLEGSFGAEYGNYNTLRFNGMVNTPVSDSVAVRLAGAYNSHNGFTATRDGNNALDDQNDFGLRVSVLADLSDSVTLYVSGDFEQSHTDGRARVNLTRALAQNDDHSLRFQNPGFDTYSRFGSGGITAELNADLGFADLTYLFGWRKSHWRERAAINDVPAPFNPFTPNGDFTSFQNHDQDSHELRLTSNDGGPLQWVLGAYYFHENTYTAPNLLFPNFGFRLLYDLNANAESLAGFAQATYEVTDGFRVTGGLRYTDDSKARTGTQTFLSLNPADFCSAPLCVSNFDGNYPGGGIKGDKFTYRLGLEADLNEDVMAYASLTTGYKAGGFNDGTPLDASPVPFFYRPETITSYEAGVKGTVLDGGLYFALSGFIYDYQDLQLGLVKNTGGAVTRNIPQANIAGLELEGYVRAGDNTRIDYSVAVLDATYGDFFPLEGNTAINFRGTPLDRSPDFTGRIALTQDIPLDNGGRISGSVGFKWSSSYVVTDGNTASQIAQDSYTRTDLTLGYFAPDDRWFLQGFVKNLENNRLLGNFELASFTLTDPRQIGLRVGMSF